MPDNHRMGFETTVVNHPPNHLSNRSPRIRAYEMVRCAVKNGKLPRLDGTIKCTDCGKPAELYEHHNYNKPLDVEPVCRKCNANRPKIGRDLRSERHSEYKDLIHKVAALPEGKSLEVQVPEPMKEVSFRMGICWAGKALNIPVSVSIIGRTAFLTVSVKRKPAASKGRPKSGEEIHAQARKVTHSHRE
jgi:hypothetical protein